MKQYLRQWLKIAQKKMPDLNDFYAFKMTSSGSGGSNHKSSNQGGNGDGCSNAFVWIAAIVSVLWIIGKLIS